MRISRILKENLFGGNCFSVIAYLRSPVQCLRWTGVRKRLPGTIGYIKSSRIESESERELAAFIDGENLTSTPLHCEAIPKAVRINPGTELRSEKHNVQAYGEQLDIRNLPTGNELQKAKKETIPFIAYVSTALGVGRYSGIEPVPGAD